MGQFKLGFETRAMKLGISISIAVILIHFGMGAPTENMKDDDYEYPDSSCGDYPEDDVVNGTSTVTGAITDYDSDNDSEKHGGKFCSGCPTGSVDYSRQQ